jgi:asparagine synthase (glutamine-hydrolysing)
MAVGLEARAPLLDHRIVEFALALPQSMKSSGGTSKWLLRQILYKKVPRELLDRPKMGFGVPMADWLKGPLRSRMTDYLASPDLGSLGIDGGVADKAWREFLSDGHRGPTLIWNLFSLLQWSRRWSSPSGRDLNGREITPCESPQVATARS